MHPLAQHVNDFRVMPKIMIAAALVFTWQVSLWFMGLDVPTTEQAAFIVSIIGIDGVVFRYYFGTGSSPT